jgi:hypothetical protein
MEFGDRIATKVIECGQVGRKCVARDRVVVNMLFVDGAVPRHRMNEKRIVREVLQSLAEVRIAVADLRFGQLGVREAFPKRTTNH